MEKKTDKDLATYAAMQAAFYLNDFCKAHKGKDDIPECTDCVFYGKQGCVLADTGWDSFYPYQWRC